MRKTLLSCILLATLGMGAQNATRFPLQPDMARSQVVRWLEKPVLDSLLVDDFEAQTPLNIALENSEIVVESMILSRLIHSSLPFLRLSDESLPLFRSYRSR